MTVLYGLAIELLERILPGESASFSLTLTAPAAGLGSAADGVHISAAGGKVATCSGGAGAGSRGSFARRLAATSGPKCGESDHVKHTAGPDI